MDLVKGSEDFRRADVMLDGSSHGWELVKSGMLDEDREGGGRREKETIIMRTAGVGVV